MIQKRILFYPFLLLLLMTIFWGISGMFLKSNLVAEKGKEYRKYFAETYPDAFFLDEKTFKGLLPLNEKRLPKEVKGLYLIHIDASHQTVKVANSRNLSEILTEKIVEEAKLRSINENQYYSKFGSLLSIVSKSDTGDFSRIVAIYEDIPFKRGYDRILFTLAAFFALLFFFYLALLIFSPGRRGVLFAQSVENLEKFSNKNKGSFLKTTDNTLKMEEKEDTIPKKKSFIPEKKENTPERFLKEEYTRPSENKKEPIEEVTLFPNRETPKVSVENLFESVPLPPPVNKEPLIPKPAPIKTEVTNFIISKAEEKKVEEKKVEVRSFEEIYEYKKNLETEIEDLSILRELNLASNAISDVKEFLETASRILYSRFPNDSIAFYLAGSDDQRVIAMHSEFKKDKVTHFDPNDRTTDRIILDVGEEGKALSRQCSLILKSDLGSSLTVPLVDKDAVIGALRLGSKENGSFNESDKFILQKIAKPIAVSLNNVTLYESAVTDGMTGLYGHKHFQHLLREELKRASRYRDNLSLAIIDIDHFKKFNDTHGHQAGDYVLKQFSNLLKGSVRSTDFCFRYGGEEFAILFIRANAELANELSDKIRSKTEELNLLYEEKSLKVTISVGVTSLNMRELTNEMMIKESDRALYYAKENGRNRVVTFGDL